MFSIVTSQAIDMQVFGRVSNEKSMKTSDRQVRHPSNRKILQNVNPESHYLKIVMTKTSAEVDRGKSKGAL